jgi:hypothetical protein
MPRTSPSLPGRPDVALVVSQAVTSRVRGRGRRSPLYLWFRENHDVLTVEFERNAPSWSKLAEVLGTHGVLDGDGKPPTARGARGAWSRVRADVKKGRERRVATPAAPAQAAPVASSNTTEASAGADVWVDEFQVAKAPVAAPPKPPVAPHLPSVHEHRNPDEVIATLLARPRQGSIPMPAIPDPEED